MIAMRHYSLAVSLVLLSLLGCDRSQPLDPTVQARSTDGASSVKAPSNTHAGAVSESRIDVSWQDNSSNESGFEVHRSTAGAAFAVLASTRAGVTGYADAGLAAATQYCYQVRSFRAYDGKTSYSAFSAAACATTPAPPPPPPPAVPAAPGGLDAKPGSSTAVTVGWSDNSTDEDGFRVERSLDGGSTWMTASTADANATFSTDDGRTSEQQVCYRVIAYNNLAWADNSGVEDGYELQRFDCTYYLECGFWTIAILGPNATSFSEEVLWGNTYTYRVVAIKDGGRSDPSNEATIYGQ